MPSVVVGGLGATAPGMGVSYLQTIFAEFIGTFFLVLVIMGVAVDKKATPNFAGLSIGFTVTAVIIFLGPFTGGSINPARTFAPYLMDYLVGGINLWMYFQLQELLLQHWYILIWLKTMMFVKYLDHLISCY
jgi:glycerol uptake facilitator protein